VRRPGVHARYLWSDRAELRGLKRQPPAVDSMFPPPSMVRSPRGAKMQSRGKISPSSWTQRGVFSIWLLILLAYVIHARSAATNGDLTGDSAQADQLLRRMRISVTDSTGRAESVLSDLHVDRALTVVFITTSCHVCVTRAADVVRAAHTAARHDDGLVFVVFGAFEGASGTVADLPGPYHEYTIAVAPEGPMTRVVQRVPSFFELERDTLIRLWTGLPNYTQLISRKVRVP
jgi:hypothetical protein